MKIVNLTRNEVVDVIDEQCSLVPSGTRLVVSPMLQRKFILAEQKPDWKGSDKYKIIF